MGLFAIDLLCRKVAAKISKHVWATGKWHDSDIGHAKIFSEVVAVGSSNYMTPRYEFRRRFEASIPDNEVWKGVVTHLLSNSAQMYTRGSQLSRAVIKNFNLKFFEDKRSCWK